MKRGQGGVLGPLPPFLKLDLPLCLWERFVQHVQPAGHGSRTHTCTHSAAGGLDKRTHGCRVRVHKGWDLVRSGKLPSRWATPLSFFSLITSHLRKGHLSNPCASI